MNRIVPETLDLQPCPAVTDPARIQESFREYLGDESRVRAESVEAIYLPETTAQAAQALAALTAAGKKCVLSGGRTGISGAAAPIGADALVTLEKMNRLLAFGRDGKDYYVRCEPGLSLKRLAELLDRREVTGLPGATPAEEAAAAEYAAGKASSSSLWFPVDPTEMTAHVGGVTATNASGARTYRYGPAREWVRAVTAVLPDGRVLRARRGAVKAEGTEFVLQNAGGGETVIRLPELRLPATKRTVGYPCQPGMDLVDLLVGSEGTLCAFCEIELRLAPRPESTAGVLAVVADEEKALALVEAARGCPDLKFDAIEYFDRDALALLRAKKEADGAGSDIPDLPDWDGAAVYLEVSGSESRVEEACGVLEELLSSVGSSIDATWAALEPAELERQKLFRHLVPESVNLYIGRKAAQTPGLHKVGTDMAVPDAALREMFGVYRAGLKQARLDSVIFGHIGNNHVHVNILPRDLEELKRAKELYLGWAKEAVRLGGAVAAEHGIGRIKKAMLEMQWPPETLESLRAVRRAFDPAGTLAPGVLL